MTGVLKNEIYKTTNIMTNTFKSSLKPITYMVEATESISKGNLNIIINMDGDNEIGLVVKNIEAIVDESSIQTESMKQLNLGIEQISLVVENNSAIAQESATTSEELSVQAELFNEIVSNFNLKN